VQREPLASREEVTAMLFAIADMRTSSTSCGCLKEATMAKKGWRKRTPEERARWRENQERLLRLAQRRLIEEGATKEQALQRLRDAK
jgi:hypothetical protein